MRIFSKRRPHSLTFTLVIVLLASGCAGLFGSPEPDLSLSLEADVDRVSLFEVHVGGRRFQVEPIEPIARQDGRAPRTGTLPVRVQLVGTTGDTLAVVEFTQRFREDYEHWVWGRVGMDRPIGHCIGELIVTPLPPAVDSSVADTLYVMHGSLPAGAVC